MILQVELNGLIPVNAYFYIDDETRNGFLIDPGAEPERLLKIIAEKNFVVEKILLTHGHFDHIGAVETLQKNLQVPVCMQKNGKTYAENPDWNLSSQLGEEIRLSNVTYLEDYSDVTLKDSDFGVKIIPVPGHTTDGAIFYSERDGVAFVGDSIFLGSVGRTDLPGGDSRLLHKSIVEKILTLPPETVLLSGHSDPTTVANELPYFNL